MFHRIPDSQFWMYYVPIDHVIRAALWFHMAEVLYAIATALIKISACLFLLSLANYGPRVRQSLAPLSPCFDDIDGRDGVATSILMIVQCIPVAGAWDPRIKAKCFSSNKVFATGYAQGGTDDTEIYCHLSFECSMAGGHGSCLCNVSCHCLSKVANETEY